MLEDTKKWYMEHVYGPVSKVNKPAADLHLAKFMSIYAYYDYFRDENWNESAGHLFEFGIKPKTKGDRKHADRTFGVILPFMDKYGNESPSYVKFSIGGIHGAEIHKKQLEKDREKIRELKEKYGLISKIPSKECSRSLLNLIIAQSRTSYNGYPVRLSHEIPYFFENTQPVDEIIDPEQFSPYMAQRVQDKITKEYFYQEDLLDRYTYTTSGKAAHQDLHPIIRHCLSILVHSMMARDVTLMRKLKMSGSRSKDSLRHLRGEQRSMRMLTRHRTA